MDSPNAKGRILIVHHRFNPLWRNPLNSPNIPLVLEALDRHTDTRQSPGSRTLLRIRRRSLHLRLDLASNDRQSWALIRHAVTYLGQLRVSTRSTTLFLLPLAWKGIQKRVWNTVRFWKLLTR